MSRPKLLAAALVALSALAFVAASPALAKKRGYKARHHTHTASFSQWTAGYDGSSSWHVVDDVVSPPPSEHHHYDESSQASWHYRAPKPEESSAFQVTYPTPCRKFHGIPCSSGDSGGVIGSGPAQLTYKLRDTFDDPAGGQQSISCEGTHDSTHTQGLVEFSAHYLRGPDAFEIKVSGSPIPSAFTEPTADCPGSDPPFDPLNDWAPPDMPGTDPGPAYWNAAPVVIPAKVFAQYRQIDIPVALTGRHAPERGCGLPPNPQSSGNTETCQADGLWKGTIRLQRAKG